jgi:GNAT superfamily N-acetyltransferase
VKTGSASVLDDAAAAVGASAGLRIRPATAADLPFLNGVVERAVMTWKLPERVKRLALPSYRYHAHDLDHQRLLVAEWPDVGIVGVAALEEADPRDLPGALTGLLLHGLYVDPAWQGQGIGSRLLAAACVACRESGHAGLLVKAQPDAAAFFQARGLLRLAVKDPDRDYPYRYWLPADSHTENAVTDASWCCVTPV